MATEVAGVGQSARGNPNERAENVTKVGPWGGTGGDAWEWNRSVQRILVEHGDVVKSISFGFTEDGGVTKWSRRFGGDPGLPYEISLEDPGEYLEEIKGTTGLYSGVAHPIITSLTFISNKRKYGPFGRVTRKKFSALIMPGMKIVRAFGRCGALLDSIGFELGQDEYSLCRVPHNFRARNHKAYTPNIVSIGPYNHNSPDLIPRENYKQLALDHLIARSKKTDEDFGNELIKILRPLRQSYEQLDKEWYEDDKFLKLMIFDGAFLLEFMRGVSGEDRIFIDKIPKYAEIIPDILMMENQLPLKVLERLIAVVDGQLEQLHFQAVYKLVFKLLGYSQDPPVLNDCLHLLDVARKAIATDSEQSSRPRRAVRLVESASSLSNAGVKFRVSTRQETSKIRFDSGIVTLPKLRMYAFTETLFLNGIAFEQLHHNAGRQLTSYVAFMSGLIRSEEDVRLLKSQDRLIDSDAVDLARILSSAISDNVLFDPFSYLWEVRDSLNDYYITKKKTQEVWTRVYLTITGGVVLLFLTIIQTVFAVLAFFLRK